MAIPDAPVPKAGRDLCAIESLVVQGHVIAGDTGSDGKAVGGAVRDTGGGLRKQVTLT
jgi:hypothetical protein